MKKSKLWTSVVESMVVMLIITIWVVWSYNIYVNSMRVSESTSYKVEAIAMAREWIEALTNIRDTNWMIYRANTTNCWNTYNYEWSCITADWTFWNEYTNIPSWSYILYNLNDRWTLSGATTWTYSSSWYRNDFRVKKDNLWFYTQNYSTWTNFFPIFTREIKISYPTWAWTPPQKMNVESIVRWTDAWRGSWNYEVKLETLLTNWIKD